jgi:hypothetical protein
VCLTVSLGNDEVSHYPPDRLLARPAKDAHGAIIPISYDAVGLHDNDRIKSCFEDQAQLVPPWIPTGKVRSRIAND